MTPLLALENVTKRYARDQRQEVVVLANAFMEIAPRESIGVIGMERSGKSTLLRVLAGALPPDDGAVLFEGRSMAAMSDGERSAIVRSSIGFADPTAIVTTRCERVVEHVALGLLSAGASLREASVLARRALARVGAGDCADLFPRELSRGEQTRVAIARALVRDPKVLLVDEPAATPRPDEIEEITRLVREIAREREIALVMASSDPLALRGADRIIHVTDGELRTSEKRGTVVDFPRSRSAS